MKKAISILLMLALVFPAMAGCQQSNPTQGGETQSQTGQPVKTEKKIFRYSDTATVSNISPFEGNTSIIDYVQAKLYRYMPKDVDGKDTSVTMIEPELAANEPYTEDGYTWYIDLDKNAKWANGEPINADTFMYSWKMALDPVLLYSATSGLAKNVIEIKNAYAYYTQASTGAKVAWEDVGLKKVDDDTLAVTATQKYTAKQVMQHFQMRYTSVVYEPLFESGMDAGRLSTNYGTEVQYFMSCGPFNLTSWTKGAERVFERNDNYIKADEIKLDGMYVRVVPDDATQLQLFQAGELDYMALGTSSYEVYGQDPRTIAYDSAVIRGIEMNFDNPDKPYLGNLNFRKALYYGVDRETVAKLSNYKPACYFLPANYSLSADGTPLRDLPAAKTYLPDNNGYDPELAKQYFEKALQETGVSKVSLNLIYNEAVGALRSSSEYLQSSLTELFGADRFELTVTAMNNTEAVKLMRTAQNGPTNGWDLCWGAWDLTAATISANRKFEPYTSKDSRRFAPYHNDELDRLYALSITEEYRLDEQKLIDITLQMEKSLLQNVDQIPVFQQTAYYLFSDRVIKPSKTRINFVAFCFEHCDIAQ
ncbi:MAG: ABC transporter substrate-binding protein [Clostridiaceae bacterium]|nr:ABC transporter substrate-binding protein [Clostridiaceae bacterium]